MSICLKMDNVYKAFENRPLFENVSFTFNKGCYSIVGPNGVGKTILLEMLSGILRQDSGVVELSGIGENNNIEFKKKLVYIPSKTFFFPSATGIEFLRFIISVKKHTHCKSKIEELITKFKLASHLNTKFSKMSLGTQRKLFLVTLAIGQNSIIILDEPTNGLDNESNEVLHGALADLSTNAVIIIATHDAGLIDAISPTIIELQKTPINSFQIKDSYR